MSARKRQVAGNHYRNRRIQPMDYAMANDFNYCQSHALTYLTRYREKGGVSDLKKAVHCLELLIEYETGRPASP